MDTFHGSPEPGFRLLNTTLGSSPIASSAYQKWPTKDPSTSRGSPCWNGATLLPHLKFEKKSRPGDPEATNHSLYRARLFSGLSYPEGNFDGYQLPSGSIGLSPLHSCDTNDLHVSTGAGLHQSFP